VTKVEYELMTIGEIVEAKRHAPLVFVPVSPIEWHGPHLPIGTDGLLPTTLRCALPAR